MNSNSKKISVWNKNFFLLWQGQLVSAIGDVFYEIALGFWVFATTGSSALMGTLMATSMIPRLVISPFAGVLVDRADRKWIIVLMDVIRGIFITVVAVLAFMGLLKIWMVFLAGIILGICAAFFNPATQSSIPDIIPKEKIIQGNSLFSLIFTGSGIIGSASGGLIYTILGAPVMFLINGLSYLFSAFTEIFIKVPKVKHETQRFNFIEDLKGGFNYVAKNKSIKLVFINACILNFFFMIGFVLIIPFFKSSSYLGEKIYGYVMAMMSFGLFAGYMFMSIIKITDEKRFIFFAISAVVFGTFVVIFPMLKNGYLMLPVVFIVGVSNACVNSIINSIMSIIIPSDKRGKVFALLGTISGGLTPLGMAIGGLLGEILPYDYIMIFSFLIAFFSLFPLIILKAGREFLNFNLEEFKENNSQSDSDLKTSNQNNLLNEETEPNC